MLPPPASAATASRRSSRRSQLLDQRRFDLLDAVAAGQLLPDQGADRIEAVITAAMKIEKHGAILVRHDPNMR
jgi:hypothetical protein